MALTAAELWGTPARADEFSLDGALESGKKATGGGTAVAVGRVVFHTTATGLWAIATSGSTGRIGVVPKLAPVNLDADPTITVATRPGAEYFVEASGAITPGSQVIPDTGGKVKSTATQGFAVYKGHDGEGSLGNPATNAAAGEAARIQLSGDVV